MAYIRPPSPLTVLGHAKRLAERNGRTWSELPATEQDAWLDCARDWLEDMRAELMADAEDE